MCSVLPDGECTAVTVVSNTRRQSWRPVLPQKTMSDTGIRREDAPIVTGVERLDRTGWSIKLALVLKLVLLAAFVVAFTVPLGQLEGKGMAYRFPLFAAAATLVPLAWRRRFAPYPATADWLVVSPFLLDTAGNFAGLYDAFEHSDDMFHFVNWVLLTAAFLAWRFRRTGSTRDARLLATGFGALAIVAWEIAEWVAGELGAGEALGLTYSDTISDLALSTTGGLIGALIGVRLFSSRRDGAHNHPHR